MAIAEICQYRRERPSRRRSPRTGRMRALLGIAASRTASAAMAASSAMPSSTEVNAQASTGRVIVAPTKPATT